MQQGQSHAVQTRCRRRLFRNGLFRPLDQPGGVDPRFRAQSAGPCQHASDERALGFRELIAQVDSPFSIGSQISLEQQDAGKFNERIFGVLMVVDHRAVGR